MAELRGRLREAETEFTVVKNTLARLARLPSREQLLGQLAGGIASPLTGLAGTLSNLIGGLARSLAALQAQREAEAPSD
jgi:large subunit ribosomal protein L10